MNSDIQKIYTDSAPAPAGHYSQAVVHNGTVYVAGQLPIDSNGNKMAGAPIEDQTKLDLSDGPTEINYILGTPAPVDTPTPTPTPTPDDPDYTLPIVLGGIAAAGIAGAAV